MYGKNTIIKGRALDENSKVLIMVHGRGASAEDILSLGEHLQVSDFTLIAPQAPHHSWYPYSFLAPASQNEPALSSALAQLQEILDGLLAKKIAKDNIFFLGFSQGACLVTEFVARNADRYGGVVVLTGGLIGDRIYKENYKGDLRQTPVFFGSSDPDPHVPVERVLASIDILKNMNAAVTGNIYKNMGHTINTEEVEIVNNLIFSAY